MAFLHIDALGQETVMVGRAGGGGVAYFVGGHGVHDPVRGRIGQRALSSRALTVKRFRRGWRMPTQRYKSFEELARMQREDRLASALHAASQAAGTERVWA